MMAVLSQFWMDHNTPDAVQALEMEGWLDVLDCLTEDEFRKAWANYQSTGPRTDAGVLKRPDPGALRSLAMKSREYARVISEPRRPPPPPDPVVSPEEMARRREFAQGVMVKSGYAKAMQRDLGPRRETVTEEDKAEMRAMLEGSK